MNPCALARCRTVESVVIGTVEGVPRHVVRLDGQNLAGWQVRFERPWRYFSDSDHGGAAASLKAAKRFLRRTWRPTPIRTSRGYDRRTGQRTQGIRMVRHDGRRGHGEWYIEASHPRHGAAKRFYVGTDSTRTKMREKEARAAALAQRRAWLAQFPIRLR